MAPLATRMVTASVKKAINGWRYWTRWRGRIPETAWFNVRSSCPVAAPEAVFVCDEIPEPDEEFEDYLVVERAIARLKCSAVQRTAIREFLKLEECEEVPKGKIWEERMRIMGCPHEWTMRISRELKNLLTLR